MNLIETVFAKLAPKALQKGVLADWSATSTKLKNTKANPRLRPKLPVKPEPKTYLKLVLPDENRGSNVSDD